MSTPTTKLTHELIRMACSAPSIHNTQPWAWRVVAADTIELHADRSRQLTETDPEGRALVISCGAALHHLTVAAAGFGLVAETHLLPEGNHGDLLARIHLEPGETTESSVQTMSALENRQTDRRGFTDWEVPGPRLRHLADLATGWGAHAVPVTDPGLITQVRALVEQARGEQHDNPDIAAEQAGWIDHSAEDGVPVSSAFPHQREGVTREADRFDVGSSNRAKRGRRSPQRGGDELMLVYTSGDDQPAWLAAGQALSALWINATQGGISLTPDTQVIEVERTRTLLRRYLLDDLGHPQVLVHVGWQETTRRPLTATPRRALGDVLLP